MKKRPDRKLIRSACFDLIIKMHDLGVPQEDAALIMVEVGRELLVAHLGKEEADKFILAETKLLQD